MIDNLDQLSTVISRRQLICKPQRSGSVGLSSNGDPSQSSCCDSGSSRVQLGNTDLRFEFCISHYDVSLLIMLLSNMPRLGP